MKLPGNPVVKTIFFLAPALVFPAFFAGCQPNPYREGERLYKMHCANCHMDSGEGLGLLIPPLAGADYLDKNRDNLPCLIKHGIKDTIFVNGKQYAEQMPGVVTLSDIHITNILNYINTSWGNRQEPFRLDEVKTLLEKCNK